MPAETSNSVIPSPGNVLKISETLFEAASNNSDLISSAKTLKDNKQNTKIGKKKKIIISFSQSFLNIFSIYRIN